MRLKRIKNTNIEILVNISLMVLLITPIISVLLGKWVHTFYLFGVFIELLVLGVILFILYNKVYLFILPFDSVVNLIRSYETIKKHLFNAGIYSLDEREKDGKKEVYFILPKINFVLIDNNEVQLQIENQPAWEMKLQNLNFSSSLRGWVVNTKYANSNQEFIEYNLEDENCQQEHFTDFDSFENWFEKNKLKKYCYVLDEGTIRPLQSLYVLGVTGSGKSFLVEILLEELLIQGINDVKITDPKRSDLAVIANHFGWSYSVSVDDTISIVRDAVKELEERQTQLYELMNNSDEVSKTYADYGLKPKIIIIDEVSALLGQCDNKKKAILNNLIRQIVLKGRQLGIYVILIGQKYSATEIPTSIKDNCGVILMGSNGAMTIRTAFNMPLNPREMPIGSGHIMTVTDVEPRFFYAPFCDYNILQILQ